MNELLDWKTLHERENPGHVTHLTVDSAPGSGFGTWCETCRSHGPSNGRVLSPWETR